MQTLPRDVASALDTVKPLGRFDAVASAALSRAESCERGMDYSEWRALLSTDSLGQERAVIAEMGNAQPELAAVVTAQLVALRSEDLPRFSVQSAPLTSAVTLNGPNTSSASDFHSRGFLTAA